MSALDQGSSGTYKNSTLSLSSPLQHDVDQPLPPLPNTKPRSDRLSEFTGNQIPAAWAIFAFMEANPDTALPASLISRELAVVWENMAWCIIGTCKIRNLVRMGESDVGAAQSMDLPELECHIRQRHFIDKIFRCSYW
jgi:hypothetical protein